MVGRRDEIAERSEGLALQLLGEGVEAPGLAHIELGRGAVALRQQRTGEREPAPGRHRLGLGEEGEHGGGAAPFLQQCGFGAPAQHAGARPARVRGKERDITAESRSVLVAAQNGPFHELLRGGVMNVRLDRCGLPGFAAPDELQGLLDRPEIGTRGGGRRRRRGGELRLQSVGRGRGRGMDLGLASETVPSASQARAVAKARREATAVPGNFIGPDDGDNGACRIGDSLRFGKRGRFLFWTGRPRPLGPIPCDRGS